MLRSALAKAWPTLLPLALGLPWLVWWPGDFLWVWAGCLLATVVIIRGRGGQTAMAATIVSAVVPLIDGLVLIPRHPDQVLRQQAIELLPRLCFAHWPFMAMAIFFAAVGFLLGSIGDCFTAQGKRRYVSIACVGSAMVGFCLFVAPRIVASNQPQQPPFPLGVSDYLPFEKTEGTAPADPDPMEFADVQHEYLPDLSYGPHGEMNTLDLYRPKLASRPLPLVVYIHGGGWAAGDNRDDLPESLLAHLLKRGFAVASINYRLTLKQIGRSDEPAAPFPAQIQDCKAAIRFLRAKADDYGLDGGKIAVMGHSAGGHLAALTGLANGVEEFEADGDNRDQSSRVQAVVALSGPTELRVYERLAALNAKCMNYPIADYLFSGPNSCTQMLLGGPVELNLEKAAKASPTNYVSQDDPPVMIVSGFRDLMVPPQQAELLYCLLQQAHVDSELLLLPGVHHDIFAQCPNGRVVDFLASRLGLGEVE